MNDTFNGGINIASDKGSEITPLHPSEDFDEIHLYPWDSDMALSCNVDPEKF